MQANYGRDLDLNLLRVFAVVADAGSVTTAAERLYLTQPAVSAALRRLATAVGTPLFVRRGRGLALTSRGERLRARLRMLLLSLLREVLLLLRVKRPEQRLWQTCRLLRLRIGCRQIRMTRPSTSSTAIPATHPRPTSVASSRLTKRSAPGWRRTEVPSSVTPRCTVAQLTK